MNGIYDRLKSFSRQGKSIKIGLAGVGQMGRGLLSQISGLDGMDVVVAADRNTENTFRTFEYLNMGPGDYHYVETRKWGTKETVRIEGIELRSDSFSGKTWKHVREARRKNRLVYCDSLSLLFGDSEIDVIIDATGSPGAGAFIALNTLSAGKHLITLNVEMDVTVGPFLRDLSAKHGVVYSLSAGDEPPAAKELYEFAVMLGMDIIAAGKGKNNPLDREADPGSIAAYAAEKGSNPYMMTSFVDGTKTMVEMACLSNATGLVPDCRGMHAVKADKHQLLDIIKPKSQGGILDKSGVVEFVIGDLAPGVFLIYTTQNNTVKDELRYLLLGEGPNYLLYRPYHLTSLETPISVARAFLYREPTMVPAAGLISEVITVAKKDLKAGDAIDRIGGYAVYGLIDRAAAARQGGLLPIGLSEGAVLKVDIEKSRPITYNDVILPADSLIHKLRDMQESRGY